MLPVVAVQVTPAPPVDKPNLKALLGTCSQALPSGACELEAAVVGGEPPAAHALVTWDELGNAVVVVQLQDVSQELSRDLVFAPEDPRLQRWRTAGLTIATMVDELRVRRAEQVAAAATPQPSAEPAPAAKPRPATPPPTAAPRQDKPASAPPIPRASTPQGSVNSMETGAQLGLGGDGHTPRAGLYAAAVHDMSGLPATAFVRTSYQLSAKDTPSVSWLELGLGGGAYATSGSVRLEVLGALQVVRIMASARSPTSGQVDAAAAWLPAATLFVRGSWPQGRPISGVLGLAGHWAAREVLVTNAGSQVERVSAYGVGLVGGIRFAL